MTTDTSPQALNNQTAFDTIIRHLRKQGRPAVNEEGTCMYRTHIGLSCAVGCLIPDSEYAPEFEEQTIDGIFDDIPSLSGVSRPLLAQMQEWHDIWHRELPTPFEKAFESELHDLAAAYNLSTTVLDEEAQTND